jgi:PIN domain nuclease of toxin-antitoxin system
MDYLLDTHVAIWAMQDTRKLSKAVAALLKQSSNRFYVSQLSLWEMAIKSSIGKLELAKPFPEFVEELVDTGFVILQLELDDILRFHKLPVHHKDAFDRLLVAQVQRTGMSFISKDSQMGAYGMSIVWK